MSVEIKFVPLTFINTEEEILRQIKNTVVFSYLFNKYEETSFAHYLSSTQYGYTASASTTGKHRLLRITDINYGKVNWENVPFCNCDSEIKYLLQDNDILIARTGGTTGKSFIVSDAPKNAVFASYLIRLRLKPNVNLDFISYFLNSYTFWSQIVEMKSGSAMPNVNAEKLKTLKLPKCEIATQNKIVSAISKDNIKSEMGELYKKLTSVERVFNNGNDISTELTHQLSLVKKLRQQLLQDAVQGKLVVAPSPLERAGGEVDEPASELLKKIKKIKELLIKQKKLKSGKSTEQPATLISEILIPDSWQWCKADEIFFITKLAGFEYTEHISLQKSGEIPVVRAQNVRPLNIDKNNILFIDAKTSQILERCALVKKCLLVTFIGAGIGDVATFEEKERWHLAPNVAKMEPFDGCEEFINVKYLNYYLMSKLGQKEIFKHMKATAQPFLSMGTIRDIDFAIPPLEEQKRIVKKLEELMQNCDALEESIKQSAVQNEKLLQQVLREALRGVPFEAKK